MMRVTNGMMQNNSISALYTNMGRMDKLFYQMNTLKKIQRPSDDPIVAGRSMKLRLNVMEAEQHASNVDEATAWMSVTEAALKNTTEIIKSIREKANYAANGTHTAEDRQKITDEITQLYEQLKQEANVTYAGRYVFSGYKTDQPVIFEKDTNLSEDVELKKSLSTTGKTTIIEGSTLKAGTVLKEDITIEGVDYKAGDVLGADVKLTADVTFEKGVDLAEGSTLKGAVKDPITGEITKEGTKLPKGTLNPNVLGYVDTQDISYEVGTNTTIEINTKGVPDMMHKFEKNIADMLEALKDPTKTDAEINELFTGMLEEMDDRLAETSQMESELGSKQNRLQYTQERLNDDKTNLTELLSNTENVDIEEVYVEFNTQYMVYQSALQATSKIVMNSLADFLR